jgi:myo-inositol-1(or 4)-monophosphatase
MTDCVDPRSFVEMLLPVVRQCAQASLIFYGRTADIGKAADTRLIGSKAQHASSVLTAIDNAVQEILLAVAYRHFPFLRCIAEEDTPFARRFAGGAAAPALLLDPIDGTLHFQRGDAPYHISIGLARQGRMEAAIVARPNEDKIFPAIRGQGAFVRIGDGPPRRLRLGARPRTNKAFISSKARLYQPFARPALDPREHPIGAALILTLMAEGELCAYLTRQVEVYDVGPPSLIAEEAGARCLLKNGQSPRYRSRRKFSYYMAAATEKLVATLFAIVRAGDRGARR